jgi:hypothetical protein
VWPGSILFSIGVFALDAARGFVSLPTVFARLKATNFRYPPGLPDTLPTRAAPWQRVLSTTFRNFVGT